MPATSVPVGVTTQVGLGTSLTAFVLAIVAFATGARDEATIGALATGLVTLVTVLLGRYAQAAKQPAIVDDDEQEPADDEYPPAQAVSAPATVPADQGDAGTAATPGTTGELA